MNERVMIIPDLVGRRESDEGRDPDFPKFEIFEKVLENKKTKLDIFEFDASDSDFSGFGNRYRQS